MKQPLVSVIVPTKNSANFLEECLESIKQQSYENIELLVVDNYSTDATPEIAKRFTTQVLTRGPERSAQVNYAVTKAKGEYVYKVDSDFVLDKDVVQQCIDEIHKGFDAVIVHNSPDTSISWIAKIRRFEVDMYKYDITHSSARFVKRDVYLAVKGFNEKITAGEDYDFQNKLNRTGYSTGYIEAEALHRGEPTKIMPHMKKYYEYGKDFTNYATENYEESKSQLGFLRSVYVKNWRQFIKHPLLGSSFLIYNLSKYSFAGAGFVYSKSHKKPEPTNSPNSKKSAKTKLILLTIKINKKLFYNTWFHRNKYVNIIYQRLFRSAYKPGEMLLLEYEGSNFYFPSDDITILPSLINNDYEKIEIDLFKNCLKKGMTVVDIGANVGLYTVIASKIVGDNGKVIAFEPEPSNYELLLKNLKLNGCKNVEAVKAAVDNKTGKSTLFMEKGSIGTHSLRSRNNDTKNSIIVDTVNIDEYLASYKKIDAIKLDVEGYETEVLSNAKHSLAKTNCLFFEYINPQDKKEIEKLIKQLAAFSKLTLVQDKKPHCKNIDPEDLMRIRYANIMVSR